MQIRIDNLGTTNPLAAWIQKRIYKQNSNCVILITGRPGTGKTYSGLALANGLYKDFDTSFICGSIEDLYKMVLKITENPNQYKGCCVIYEESNTEQNKMRSMSTEAVSYTTLLSTFRSLNIILIVTAPYGSHLQKQALDYTDIGLQTESLDRQRNLCNISVKFYERNEETGRLYKKFLTVFSDEGIFKLARISVRQPPKNLTQHYENMKLKFQREYYSKELGKITRKQTKTKIRDPRQCKHCKYRWIPRKDNPKKCPKCLRPL